MASRSANIGLLNKYKLYVSNLPWTVADKQLREYFSQFGQVSRAIVMFDKSTGMSKGYGFVTFSTDKSMNAIQHQLAHKLEGHTLNISTVNVSKQTE